MRLGIAKTLEHHSPKEWAEKHSALGLSAVCFPVNCNAEKQKIIDYKQAANDYGLVIAEVGAWCNLLDNDPQKAKDNLKYCLRTMEMADKIGAKCVVNISGSLSNKFWDGGAQGNYTRETFDKVVSLIQKIISVSENCPYTLEPMPWMIPYDVENYLAVLQAVNDSRFAVHMDAVNMIYTPKKYFFQREYLNEIFGKLGTRIVSAHLKDLKLSNRLPFQLSECAPLTGDFQTLRYLKLLEEQNKEMPVIIEHLDNTEDYLSAIHAIKKLCGEQNIFLI